MQLPELTSVVEKAAAPFGWRPRVSQEPEGGALVTLEPASGGAAPVTLSLWTPPESGRVFFWFRVRTLSFHYAGDRTDLHDVLSTLMALLVNVMVGASCRLHDILNPATGDPDELYGRFIVIDQPWGGGSRRI